MGRAPGGSVVSGIETCHWCDAPAELDGLCEPHALAEQQDREYDLAREAGLRWDNQAQEWVR